MEEIWKDIPGYQGFYQASNLGRIKSLKRTIVRSNGWPQTFRERILKQGTSGHYNIVRLGRGERKIETKTVHRLIIESFIENTEHKIDVNHKDSNKRNNCLYNLEYATRSENMDHAYSIGGCISKNKGKIGKYSKLSKIVYQYDLENNLIAEYYGTGEVSRRTNFKQPTISKSCHYNKISYGFKWSYIKL